MSEGIDLSAINNISSETIEAIVRSRPQIALAVIREFNAKRIVERVS